MNDRKKIDLQKLPTWLQYTIAIIVINAIVIAGYLVGRDKPMPYWIENYLIPGLGWLGLVLILLIVIDWMKNILSSLHKDQPRETTPQSSADNTDTND